MVYSILVGYDGSKESKNALELACGIGSAMDASITVVHTVQPNIYEAAKSESTAMANFAEAYRREILKTIDDAENQGQEYLTTAKNLADTYEQSVTTKMLYGDPANKMLEYVHDEGHDLIIIGHQGSSDRRDTSIGSVAFTLIERAEIPVLVAR